MRLLVHQQNAFRRSFMDAQKRTNGGINHIVSCPSGVDVARPLPQHHLRWRPTKVGRRIWRS